jgi:hypothetical protein
MLNNGNTWLGVVKCRTKRCIGISKVIERHLFAVMLLSATYPLNI